MNSSNTVRLQLIIPVDVDTDFRVEAARQRKTISALAAEAFKEYIGNRKVSENDSKAIPQVIDDTEESFSFAPAVA